MAERSFEPRRHRRLLDGQLLENPMLRVIQAAYQRAESEPEKRRVAHEFRGAVLDLPEADALERIRCMQLAEFCRVFLTDFKGFRHGLPLELEPFQVKFDADVERRGDDGERLFSIANLIIPRGCGKTTFAAAKCLFEILRRPQKTEGYFIAESKEQAARAFDFVSTWVRMNEALLGLSELTKDGLTVKATGSTLRVVSARGASFYGTSPGFVCADESWVWRREEHKDLWNAAATGVSKAPDGLLLMISTPPESGDSLLGDLLANEIGKQELVEHPHGGLTVVRDERSGILTYWFGLQSGADVDDEHLWRLANPAGFKSLKVLRQQREVLRSQPGMFELLHLGMLGADPENQLVAPAVWDACLDPELVPPEDASVHLGVESSFGGRTVAIGLAWRAPDGRVAVAARVFATEGEPTAAHERKPEWKGRVDVGHVVGWLGDIAASFRVRSLVFDQHEVRLKPVQLAGLNVTHVRSGSSAQKEASRRLFSLIENRELAHVGDEVLRDHVLSTRGVFDRDGRLNVYKRDQTKQISAWYALCLAITQLPEQASVYEERGVLGV